VNDPAKTDAAAAPAPPLLQRVFAALADGAVHSGEQLALAEDVSRSGIWKAVGSLQQLGVPVESVAHRGYRLAVPLVPLDAARIDELMSPLAHERLRGIEVAWSLPSTNSALLARGEHLARAAPPPGRFDLLAAEHQTAGRRAGRCACRWAGVLRRCRAGPRR
jgi:BirA family transcriptional regulator, biotin operon repressor / biotin---[acetyl-CoA-carboxylase] ligase